ncbi:MAG: YicC family protein [Spirochaetaceae bacterium]|jgi:uncharacterized protein (TIGR00255 family)|nr:YicC family protein [Spirochaetaceae bacterium]
MISMTGFGHSEYQDEKLNASLEIKSYNNRYLDLAINMPSFLNVLEPEIRSQLSSVIQRGRVEVYLKIREKEEDLELIIDKKAAMGYRDSLEELKNHLGLSDSPMLVQIIGMEGVLKVEKKKDPQALSPVIKKLFDQALDELQKTRQIEGNHTQKDILQQLQVISEFRNQVRDLAPQVEETLQKNLREKFQQVLGDEVEENRILTEVASYLVRYDINEEISRLSAHLESFLSLVESQEPVGKKLDFLCQEMNREINTMGSKTPQIEVQRRVVDAKDAMEKIREQLRNVQ